VRLWLPFIYHFGVGALVMGIGLFLIVRARAARLDLAVERRWVGALVGGYFFLFVLYLTWMLISIHVLPNPVGV
jgi:hypothetical protein